MMRNVYALLTLALICLNSFGQQYEILNVEPGYVVPGGLNELSVSLNSILAEGDSVLYGGLWIYFTEGPYDDTLVYNESLEIIDSIVNISFSLAANNYDENAFLFLGMKIQGIYDSISYYPVIIGNEVSAIEPAICLVSVDSTGTNLVVWEYLSNESIDSVIIYKETGIANEYQKIGSKGINDLTTFADTASIPSQQASTYKIAFIDTSGNKTTNSEPHRTIHLTASEAIGGGVNLSWASPFGFFYSTFHIYRGTSKDDMINIADVPANQFTFSDLAPPPGNLFYQVAVSKSESCTIRIPGGGDEIISESRSNYIQYNPIINSTNLSGESLADIYPNPFSDIITVRLKNKQSIQSIKLFNSIGQILMTINGSDINSNLLTFNLNGYPGSVFIIQIKTGESIIVRRLIKI